MALRAKPPEPVSKRLKLFLYGPAGVGKTTAAIQFPNAYIIDCEKGAQNYEKLINASGGVVFETNDMQEAISEVKALLSEKHTYRTLVIDPITALYNDLLEKAERKVGTDFGRHYGEANKTMKRLANLIMALDMNVVITSHAKKEYAAGAQMAVIGQTFDAWKQLDYWFDLVIELAKEDKRKKNGKRYATVVKTRMTEQFPDGDVFEWSYAAIEQRYDPSVLGREAAPVELASKAQVMDMLGMLDVVRLPEDTVEKWFKKAGVDAWEDMPAAVLAKCIEFVKNRLPSSTPRLAVPPG